MQKYLSMDILTPKNVLEKIASYLGLSIAELSEKVGYDRPQAFYDVINGKTKKISSTMANRIIAIYPEFNLSWLLTGKGDMINSDTLINSLLKLGSYLFDNTEIKEKLSDYPQIEIKEVVDTEKFKEWVLKCNQLKTVFDYTEWPQMGDNLGGAIFLYEFIRDLKFKQDVSPINAAAKTIPIINENESTKELQSTIASQQKTIERLTEMLYSQNKKADANMGAEVADAM